MFPFLKMALKYDKAVCATTPFASVIADQRYVYRVVTPQPRSCGDNISYMLDSITSRRNITLSQTLTGHDQNESAGLRGEETLCH